MFRMESNRVVLVILVFVCLCKTSSTGSISLCRDNTFSFVNGSTIPAMVGKPVSVVFCVQCTPGQTISRYIRIEHANYLAYKNKYFTNNRDERRPLKVNIDSERNTAKVKITIKNVSNEDLANMFSVIINTQKSVSDLVVVVFTLTEVVTSDPVPSDTSSIISTEPNLPPVTPLVTWTTSISTTSSTTSSSTTSSSTTSSSTTSSSTTSSSTTSSPTTSSSTTSSSTEFSTVNSPATTAFLTPVMSTEAVEKCRPNITSRCPENWYQVDIDTCLLVIPMSNKRECDVLGSKPVTRRHLNKLRTCLLKILDESWSVSSNYVIRLNKTRYINVQSGENTTTAGNFNVACINRTFEFPTVSNFSVQIWDGRKWSLVDTSTRDITLNTTSVDARLTCHAEGHPQPDVTITDGSHQLIRSGRTVRITCSQAAVFTCVANNSQGASESHRRIQIVSPVSLEQFTVERKPFRWEIRSGETVEMSCAFVGCPKLVTITNNNYSIAESTTPTSPLVHEITAVNCSHMGTYTCLARSQSGQDVQKSADLEVKGCPVSLCQSQDRSREMSPSVGGNLTFSICLMSSESLRDLTNEAKIFVKLTRISRHSFYWTANITMNNIQEEDYTTHTVTVKNSEGSLVYHITLKRPGTSNPKLAQKDQESETESNVLLLVLLPICFIIIVCFIVGITWYRVKGTCISRSRAEKSNDSGDEASGEVLYANLKETSTGRFSEVKDEDRGQELNRFQCHESEITTDLNGKDSGRITTEDGLVYVTVVSANKQVNRKSQRGQPSSKLEWNDGGHVEYLTLDFEKTGKFIIVDEEENKEEHMDEEIERQQ